MRQSLSTCPRCGHMLNAATVAQGGALTCPSCKYGWYAAVFPRALGEHFAPEAGHLAVETGSAVCFYHPASTVESACDQCGRLLCRLCAMPMPDKTYCPQCLRLGFNKSGDTRLRAQYFRQDRRALVLAFLPLSIGWCVLPALVLEPALAATMFFTIVIMVSLVTAPITLFSVIRYWSKAEAPLARTRPRFVLAALLAAGQGALWLVGLASLASAIFFSLGRGA